MFAVPTFTAKVSEALASIAPWMGEYSLGKHMLVGLALLALTLIVVRAAAKLRGLSSQLVRDCTGDVLLAALLCMTVLLFPVGFLFMVRALYRAFFYSEVAMAN